jgi:hypothetical protein
MKTLEELMAPVKQLTELNRMKMEKAVEAGYAKAKEYKALTEKRVEAARGIKDAASCNEFMMEQIGYASSSMEKMLLDSKAFLTEAISYNNDVMKLLQSTEAKKSIESDLKAS